MMDASMGIMSIFEKGSIYPMKIWICLRYTLYKFKSEFNVYS